MQDKCKVLQDELVTLLYEGESSDPAIKNHLKECASCSQTFKDYQNIQSLYQTLPDPQPSYAVSEKVLTQGFKPRLKYWESVRRIFTHPAVVAISVFLITLGGTFLYKKYFSPQGPSFALKEKSPDAAPAFIRSDSGRREGFAPTVSSPLAANANLRLVDWNPMPRLDPSLDRPVLKHTDMANLENAAIESVASFKHQIAMRHILDGEYAKACQVLDTVIDHYLTYSHWEQAVILHIRVMKKLGRQDEIQRDLNRLREYAMAGSDSVALVESEIR